MRCLLSMSHQKKYRGYVCGGWNKFNCGQKKALTRSYDKFSNARHSTIKWQLRKHFLCVSADHSAFLHLLFLLTIFFARKMRGKKCAKKRLKIINKFMFALTFEKLPMSSLSFYYLIIIIILISKREKSYEWKK